MTSFYSPEELDELGLKSCGENVFISRKCSLYGAEYISLGDNVRIDDFCILSGKITLGSHIHISAGSYLFAGDAGIIMRDFSGISSHCAVYAVSDDYSGAVLTNAVIPDDYKNIVAKQVVFEKHVLVGTSSVILPGVVLAEGSAIGAMSLVTQSTIPWKIYCGVPAYPIKNRLKDLLKDEKRFLGER